MFPVIKEREQFSQQTSTPQPVQDTTQTLALGIPLPSLEPLQVTSQLLKHQILGF